MPDYIADILSPWTIGGEGQNTWQLGVDYLRTLNPDGSIDQDGVYNLSDITGTAGPNLPPTPNLCVVRAVMPEATLDAIQKDGTYSVLASAEMT
jgi:hypothetical protein